MLPIMLPLLFIGFFTASCSAQPRADSSFPAPANDPASTLESDSAVLAAGCFWGVEAVFSTLRGVLDVESGYAGGSSQSARYELVSNGSTGHAEAVRIRYDPRIISYGTLLKVYFSVVHDPTQINRQGNDIGSQYRSAIFYANNQQKLVAQSYIEQLNKLSMFGKAIATTLEPLTAPSGFFLAEDYHQNYSEKNPTHPYVIACDVPKMSKLRSLWPALMK